MTNRYVLGGIVALAVAVGASACQVDAPGDGATLRAVTDGPDVPYKLGTFERDGKAFMGLVLRDTQAVDIAQANVAFENGSPAAPKLAAPADLKELIAKYDMGWKDRLVAIARAIPAEGQTLAFVYPVDGLKALPPVRPSVILNAGGNYTEHTAGIAAQAARAGARAEAAVTAVAAPGIWERKPDDPRPENPYIFLKSPTVMAGANDPIVIPRGRTNIDFE